MIDLHLHTTASDGTLAPADLVERAAAAGITTLAVTDHDTVAGLEAARRAAALRGLTFVNGIEITAVENGRDVHVLGYFFDPDHEHLRGFLQAQRADRMRRVREMAERLAAAGAPIDPEPLLIGAAERDRSIGRPALAGALMAAGHVQTRDEAFERYLGRGRPAFVPRRGASACDVVRMIAVAGGLSSLAHPGLTSLDAVIPAMAAAGLDALEARHTDHDQETETRYRLIAAELGLAVSGGSDYHGDDGHHRGSLGLVALPEHDYAAFAARASKFSRKR